MISIPGFTLTAAEAIGLSYLQGINGSVKRGLFGDDNNQFTAQVTVEENHSDDSMITQHPVEQGAAITDHVYDLPARLTVRYGWSNSPSPENSGLLAIPGNILGGLLQTAAAFSGPSSYVNSIYAKLLQTKSKAQLLKVITGKRVYENMAIRGLATVTDENTENALMIIITLQEIIIVKTQVISVPPTSVQANPQKTGAPQDTGQLRLQSAPLYTPQ